MLKQEVLHLLDNNGKILYILLELGSLRFEEIVQVLSPMDPMHRSVKSDYKRNHMSRATIAKHLNYLKDDSHKFITIYAEIDPLTKRNIQKYAITETGKAYLMQLTRSERVSLQPHQFEIFYSKITAFFQQIGVDQELYLPRIIKMIARIDQTKFFDLPQTQELYYTLLYIFQNLLENSLGTLRIMYFDLPYFCQTYKISSIQIQYNLEKLLNPDIGFYRIPWHSDLFFHRHDLIGGMLFHLIRNELEGLIVERSLGINELQSFNKIADGILNTLEQLQLVKPSTCPDFKNVVVILLIDMAIELGFTQIEIAAYWKDLQKIGKTTEGIEYFKVIFGYSSSRERIHALNQAFKLLEKLTSPKREVMK